jgi:hypothetical protein
MRWSRAEAAGVDLRATAVDSYESAPMAST